MNHRLFRLLALAALLAGPAALLAQTMPAGGVGIGTTAPDASAALDIVSSDKGLLLPRVAAAAAIASPAPGLLVYQTGSPAGFYYNAGTAAAPGWQQLATAAGTALDAGNGLTKTGSTLELGGPLRQPTTLDLAGRSLTLASPISQQISQLASSTTGSTSNAMGVGQSFTLPAGATLTQVEVYAETGGSGTLTIYEGAPGGPVLGTPQAVVFNPGFAPTSIVLDVPVTVGAAGTYSFSTDKRGPFALQSANPYAGGLAYGGAFPFFSTNFDMKFVVYYTAPAAPVLHANGAGRVGIGTAAPTAALDVAGSARLRGLGAGLVQSDGDGNLSTTAALTGADFIQNQTAATQTGGFRLSGDGRLGGSLGLGTATATPRGRLDVASGDSYLVANPNNGTAGQSVYLPGHLFLAPYSGTSGTAFVQARVPNPGTSTNIGLTLRTTSAGTLTDALSLAPSGNVRTAADLDVAGSAGLGYRLVQSDYTVAGNAFHTQAIACPAGMRVMGGGGGNQDFTSTQPGIVVSYNGPDPANPTTGWALRVQNTSNNDRAIRVYCNCARIR
ncbi:hypothetical protein [Hymenobacter ruricola]|uniref:Uncharacterized protein n=1 Tax=Hymenobacter ruricola TaxID=2791023 RepID=A0ABS0I7P5_9BACT|nr:hypothetical protein [Hymenobacter ruricola]MBF9222786.1 hypothetical protein [Hymenobacter ruricola]